jgi:hypothetical protein
LNVFQGIGFIAILVLSSACLNGSRGLQENYSLHEGIPGNGVSGEGERFLFTTQFPQVVAMGGSYATDFLKNSVVVPALRQAYQFPEALAFEMAQDCVPPQVNILGYRSANVYIGSYLLHATYEVLAEAPRVSLQSQWSIGACSPNLLLLAYLESCREPENAAFQFSEQTLSCALTDLPDSVSPRVRGYLQTLATSLGRSHVVGVTELDLDLSTEI